MFTEDNNTRVLFERVLSSGGLTSQLSVDVWNRFLEFESNIGDLSSIVKVERRRSSVLETVTPLINARQLLRAKRLICLKKSDFSFTVERI